MDSQAKGYRSIDVFKVLPSPTGCAVCLGNKEKIFVIYVGPNEGAAILMILQGIKKTRPLTHDLISNIFKGLMIKVEYTLINDLKDNTYYARLILKEENSLGKNILELDARPSDCIAIAKQQGAPIYITDEVFEKVEDVSHLLNKEPSDEEGEEGSDFNLFGDEEK
ncbi:MAG: bifunctional nuclease family protein [Candidatus Aureabacteria bacterium]|nr:bifunctional nuclease family protein [Candidatus Auribacterota bacterium]